MFAIFYKHYRGPHKTSHHLGIEKEAFVKKLNNLKKQYK